MPAQIHNVPFKEDDFKERVSYADLEEGDHIATLIDVEDAEASTGNYGWRFVFDVKGLPLNTTVWLRGGGAWKVREVFNALGTPINPGTDTSGLNPNPLIGRKCVVTVKRQPASNGALNDDNTPKMYTNIIRHTPYVAMPASDFESLVPESYGGTE